MKTIFKYPLLEASQTVLMPKGAQVLCVQMQGGNPCIWALVDDRVAGGLRTFRFYGTGHNMPPNPGEYIGTVQGSGLVFHLFESTKSPTKPSPQG